MLDFFISVIYCFLIISFAYFYQRVKIKDNPEYKWYTKGLLAKIVGGLFFAIVYTQYYGFGDTFRYFKDGIVLSDFFFSNPSDYFKVLFNSREFAVGDYERLASQISFSHADEEWFMVKIVSFIALLGFQKFWATTIIFSVVSYLGSWSFFKFFLSNIKISERLLALFILFIPSVLFWSSSILKDNITYTSLGVLVYVMSNFFFKNKRKVLTVVIILTMMYVSFFLKSYIITCFLPCFLISIYIFYKNKINNFVARIILAPLILFVLIAIGVGSSFVLVNSSEKLQIDQLESRIKGFQGWHETLGGSYYSLGKIDLTPTGILKKWPAALGVTFYGPKLWEIRNPAMALTALESFILLLLSIYILIKLRLSIVKLILKNHILILSFTFCASFGLIVGLTSYNYGALARYKIPCLPFFYFLVAYFIDYISKKNKIEESH